MEGEFLLDEPPFSQNIHEAFIHKATLVGGVTLNAAHLGTILNMAVQAS